MEPKTSLLIGATILALTGVEPQPIFWALVGATFGLSLAPPTGRVRAIIVFITVVLLSALAGSFLASITFSGGGLPLARNAFSAGVATFFHPLMTAFVNALPALFQALIQRVSAWLPGSKP